MKNLEITFDDKFAFEINPPGVAFPAIVDGENVRCWVSSEALEDWFGARGRNDAMLAVFKENRLQIQEVARAKIQNGERPVVLSTDFQKG